MKRKLIDRILSHKESYRLGEINGQLNGFIWGLIFAMTVLIVYIKMGPW